MTRVGDDLVEALTEMAACLRGGIAAESYDLLLEGSTTDVRTDVSRVIESAPVAAERTPKRK
jgi:hypothetical protein